MIWFLIALAFALVISRAYALAMRRGANFSDAVGEIVQAQVPTLLALTLGLVGVPLLLILGAVPLAREAMMRSLAPEASGVIAGALVGAGIAAFYFGGLDRGIAAAQRRFGDYVPAGSTAVLGTNRAGQPLAPEATPTRWWQVACCSRRTPRG